MEGGHAVTEDRRAAVVYKNVALGSCLGTCVGRKTTDSTRVNLFSPSKPGLRANDQRPSLSYLPGLRIFFFKTSFAARRASPRIMPELLRMASGHNTFAAFWRLSKSPALIFTLT